MTPFKLAVLSLAVGLFPLLLSLCGMVLARCLNCKVNAAGAEKCMVFGVDISNVLYTLFMMHWLTIFSGGLAVYGLIGAGIWAWLQ